MSLEHAKKGDILDSSQADYEKFIVERIGDLLFIQNGNQISLEVFYYKDLEFTWKIKQSKPINCNFIQRCRITVVHVHDKCKLENYCLSHQSFDCPTQAQAEADATESKKITDAEIFVASYQYDISVGYDVILLSAVKYRKNGYGCIYTFKDESELYISKIENILKVHNNPNKIEFYSTIEMGSLGGSGGPIPKQPLQLELGKVYEDRESHACLIIKNDFIRMRGICLSSVKIRDFTFTGNFISENSPHDWDLINLSSDQRPYRI